MKQQMNRILSLLLALLLCVGLFALPVSAEEGICGENLTWKLENGVLTISGQGAMSDFSDAVPAPWMDSAELIQCVVIGEGITSIGSMAFYHLRNLKIATLPETVKIIGSLAFAGCYQLEQVRMNGVEELKWACFYECLSLKNVVLPQTLRIIGKEVFYRCTSLGGIIIPASVEKMGSSVFTYCTSLAYVSIEAPITILPYWTFYGCTLLSYLYLPASVEVIDQNALVNCPDLYKVDYDGSDDTYQEIKDQLSQDGPTQEDPSRVKEVEYSQTEGAVVTTTTTTVLDDSSGTSTSTQIDATVTDESGWEDVAQNVTDVINQGKKPIVNIQVEGGSTIPAGVLAVLSDRNITVNIQSTDNADWKVILKDQTAETVQGKQNLNFQISRFDSDMFADVLGGAESYLISLGSTTLNTTLLIPLGSQAARQVATLYAVSGRKLNKLSSVIVDYDGKAAFCLAGTSAGDYILALNVPNIDNQEVLVPEKLAPEFDITYGATLTDSQGNQYILTGRVNKLGFGLGTLTWIIVGVLGGSVILVGVIMVIWNKQQQKMYKQRRKSK